MQETASTLPASHAALHEAQPPLTQAERLIDTFTAPAKTFVDIRRNQSWWLPFVVLAVFSYLFTAAAATHIGFDRLAESAIRNNPSQSERLQQAAPEQRAQTLRITATVMRFSFLASPALLLLFTAVAALLLWMGFNFLLGGTATYQGMYAVMMFAWLPSAIRSVLTTVLLFLGDAESFNINDPIGTNPGFYLPAGGSAFLKSLLTSLDVFTLWTLILAGVGGAIVAGVKPRSGVVLVAVAWLVVVLIKAGVAAATS